MIPSVGRIVHFVLQTGEHRPAIIVRVWDKVPTEQTAVQLQVFTDGCNDGLPDVVWKTSVCQDPTGQKLGTFHLPELV